jgi:hypothetical protein
MLQLYILLCVLFIFVIVLIFFLHLLDMLEFIPSHAAVSSSMVSTGINSCLFSHSLHPL